MLGTKWAKHLAATGVCRNMLRLSGQQTASIGSL
jgi:hypothetical protein